MYLDSTNSKCVEDCSLHDIKGLLFIFIIKLYIIIQDYIIF